MSETLEERLRRDARDNCVVRAHVYARDVVKLLDERDAVIAELDAAHNAQNAVLARMQESLKISYDMADALSGGNAALRAERDALRAENDALCDALRKTRAELASAKLGIQ